MTIRIVVLLALALMSEPSLAASSPSTEASAVEIIHTYDYVKMVEIDSGDYVYLEVAGGFTGSQASCATHPSFGRMRYVATREETKTQLRLAIASFVARAKVRVTTNGCTTGFASYRFPLITAIGIQRD